MGRLSGAFRAVQERRMATAETTSRRLEFTNEAFVDFSRPENKSAMEAALAKVKAEFGKEYPMYIGGEKVYTTGKMSSTNPSHPSEVIGVFQAGTKDNADAAVAAAWKAFETWKKVPVEERAECLFRAAKIVRDRKFEISAWIATKL